MTTSQNGGFFIQFMQKVTVTFSDTRQKSYDIIIGNNLLHKLSQFIPFDDYSNVFVLTDKNVGPLYLPLILSAIPIKKTAFTLPAGEKTKNIDTVKQIWEAMHTAHCDRKSLVLIVGGGVLADMGGFAASTYMRGLDFINIPTTLLSQVDASIGGKLGIDFAGIKNLIGTFTSPKGIIIDTQTLSSLPKRELLSGLSEVIKYGLIYDKRFFEKVTSKHFMEFTRQELLKILTKACKIKAKIISSDTSEQGSRKILNFGHTIGHAIEAVRLDTDAPLLHGEAVSVGMVAEAKISQLMGYITEEEVALIKKSLDKMWLPTTVTDINVEKVMEKMLSDKKNAKGEIHFVLLESIGKSRYNEKVKKRFVTEALLSIMQ